MSDELKAWVVSDGEWWELLHAETSGKARSKAAGLFSDGRESRGDVFLCLHATRLPTADGRAFTVEDRREVNGVIEREDGEYYDDYISECDCARCNPKSIELSND